MSFLHLAARVAEVERKLHRSMVPATVYARDKDKGTRYKLGEDDDGQPVLSNWVQPADQNVGTRSRWVPHIGQQALLLTEPGSDNVEVAVPMSHHDGNPPSQNPAGALSDVIIYDDGVVSVSITEQDRLVIVARDSVIRIDDQGVFIKGPQDVTIEAGDLVSLKAQAITFESETLTHNEVNIGYDHVHTQVESGGSLSGPPPG